MTAFYTPLRLLQDAISQIITIDTQLTSLGRVTDEQTDLNQVLQDSIELADRLGNKVTEINEGLIEFARQGFSGNDLLKITEAATLMSNVSDLSVEESASSLTSALKGFNMEADQAIHVVDALNEVDNKFAISTKDLAQVIMKAAGSANTFGVSLESLIGHATAIGQVTQESGSIIGNSLKTIYSRITTMDDSISMLESVGVAVRDMSGQIRPVEDILDDLAKRWSSLSAEQQQALGVQLAGRYQLSRFLVLMQQYSQALKAQQTAINSNGSAYRENQRYLDSYQARLNRLSNAWTETTLAMQKAFLGTGIIAFAELMTAATKAATSFIDTFGLLPPVLGAVTTGFLLFNRVATMNNGVLIINTLKGLVTGFKTLDGAIAATTLKMRIMDAVSKTTTVAITGLRTALVSAGTFLAGAVLPTAAFMALGWAIGKVTEKIVDYNEHQRQIKQETEQLTNTYKTNEDKIQSLADKYEKLSNEVNKGLRPDNDKEYLQVQQELANLIPTLVDHYDSKQRAHLKNAEAVRQEIASLKELANLENVKFMDNFSNNIDKVKSKIDDLQKQINNIKNPPMTAIDWKAGIPKELTTEDKIDIAIKQREINAQIEQAIGLYKQYAQAYAEYLGVEKQLTDKDKEYINTLIEKNKAQLLTKDGQKEVTRAIQEYISKASEVRKVTGDLFSGNQIRKFTQDEVDALKSVANAIKNGNTNWDTLKKKLTDAGFSSKEASKAIKYLNGSLNENKNAVKSSTISLDELEDKLKEAKGDFDALAKIIIQLAKQGNYNEAITIAMSDAYQAVADKVAPLNELLEKLAEGKQISAAEAMELIQKNYELADAISIENGQVKVNIEAVQAMRAANISAYTDKLKIVREELLASKRATLEKLGMYKSEVLAIQTVADAEKKRAEISSQMSQAFGSGNYQVGMALANQVAALGDLSEELGKIDKLMDVTYGGLSQVGTSFENLSDAEDKANKSTEKSIYVADKYKHKIEEVELALEKQEAILAKFPDYSKEYQNALRQEINLLTQKKKIIEQQAKDLERQIKSGKIQQTGIVTVDSGSSYSYSSSSSYSGKYANIINEAARRYGIDPNLIAAVIRVESNFNPRARSSAGAMGLMQLMPGTARSLGVTNPYDPYQNIMGGAKYLAQQLKRFGGSIEKALAAYNAGPGNVIKYGGIPPFRETQNYVKKVTQYYRSYSGGKSIDVSDISRQQAEAQQAIDDAKSQLSQMKSDIANLDVEIAQKQIDLINAQIASFEHYKSNYDKVIEDSENRLYRYNQASELYRKEIEKQQKALAGKAKENQKEIRFLQSLIKQGGLSAAAIDQIKQKLHELGIEQEQMNQKMMELNKAMVDSVLAGYEDKIAQYDEFLGNSEIRLGRLLQSSEAYRKELVKQKEALAGKYKEQGREIKYLQYAIKNYKLAPEALEEYKNKLNELKDAANEVVDKQKELNKAIIDSKLNFYDDKETQYDQFIENSNIRLERLLQGSEAYRKELERQRQALAQKNIEQRRELEYLENAIKNYDLAPEVIEEYKQKIHELGVEINNTTEEQKKLNGEFIKSWMTQYDDLIDDIDYQLERSQLIQDRYTEGSAEWKKEMELQNELLAKKAQLILEQRNKLKELLQQEELTAEQRKEYIEQLEDLSIAYNNVLNSIKSNIETEKEYREQLADQVIDTIKNAYEKQKELELAAIDQQMEALEKAHEKQMEMYDEDLNKFEEVINAKLRLIDRQADEEDFNKELSKLQKQEQEIRDEINKLSLDDSYEAKARKKELEKELADITEQIEELKTNRERELRKQNLQDELESYTKEIEGKKEAEQEKYETEKETLEKLREEREYYYDELIKNEQYYAQLREQIYQGNTSNILNLLSGFLSTFEKYNQNTVKNLKSSWSELFNLIISIKELMDNVSNMPNSPLPSDSDFGNLRGRLETGQMARSKAESIKEKMEKDYGAKNVQLVKEGMFYKVIGEFDTLDRANKVLARLKELYYVMGKVEAFDTGGYTGNQEGLAFLHKKELVLNNIQTEHILKSVSILDKFKNILPKFNIPTLKLLPATATGRQPEAYNYEYNINIHIENMNGDKNSLNTLSNQIIQKIKQTRGGRF